MIDPKRLLTDLQRRCTRLEDDLRSRSETDESMGATLRGEYDAARAAGRTAEAFEVWRDGVLTQAAVAWLLGCVFVRFLEDNGLIDPMISGPGDRRQEASDAQEAFFRKQPMASDRDYLQDVFERVRQFKVAAPLYDPDHNPLWAYSISGDMAKDLLLFWRSIVPETGELVHDFTDPEWRTRFLGDLYQDLSESARKRYALLQTPEFVEEFILDRTLDPALEEFGLKETRLIDPTCGSGHFLLGAFERLLDRWFKAEPAIPERELAQRALNGVYGVDLNPFAVAIARFRLLIAALKASLVQTLKEAPDFKISLATGDSLLHGKRFDRLFAFSEVYGGSERLEQTGYGHSFQAEDLAELNRILGQQYHAVVGNPPYITASDPAINAKYRELYATCHRKYSLGVPFTERFFDLAIVGVDSQSAGFVGMITADSFMKREFGKKLIEEFLPRQDLTHAISTAGASIPGHNTPTVILLGRHRGPVAQAIRVVMGIKGEPGTPEDPAKGLVWQQICTLVDQPGSTGEFVSVADVDRNTLAKHPWSIGGGGAAELKEFIDANAGGGALDDQVASIGFGCIVSEEEAFFLSALRARSVSKQHIRQMAVGDGVREWSLQAPQLIFFPYDGNVGLAPEGIATSCLWNYRATLASRAAFGKQTYKQVGRPYYEYHQIPIERNKLPLSIVFAFVATHNHFVLDRGGKVFKQTAPVIKLGSTASEDDHLKLLGVLNSSIACFWLKQVCFPKDANKGTLDWENRYEFDGTKVGQFPLSRTSPLALTRQLDYFAQQYAANLPSKLTENGVLDRNELDRAHTVATKSMHGMIAIQEEIDWHCYRLYSLSEEDLTHPNPPEVRLGERAFEIVMARQMAAGELETAWFESHRSTPVTEIPTHWPDDYKSVVEKRIALIESDRNIALIEKPEYKRRWNTPAWEELEKEALREWLIDRLEDPRYWANEDPMPQTVYDLASKAQTDAEFLQVAELYVGHEGVDLRRLVAELVESESVPFLPVLRYKESGLRHRAVWERTWELQRREDAGEDVGTIPPPPKYKSADFLSATYWRLRGALDVPKERFISYPHCSRDGDPSLLVGWAGWDHLRQARALTSYLTQIVTNEGWSAERLTPLFAGLQELTPWLKQWHNEIDPEYDQRMGDFFEGYLLEQLHLHQLTVSDLKAWKPPATAARRGRRASVSN
ncbi:BREX-2 system adenine-specific DNA-methyltransferase PglX [bacterium]|nr:BREX-2 system adenine-specific DNA-methyltransferase PglX [bacterium]